MTDFIARLTELAGADVAAKLVAEFCGTTVYIAKLQKPWSSMTVPDGWSAKRISHQHSDMSKTIQPLKTREQVLADFKNAGITLSEWSRANGFHRMTVVDLLRGSRQGLRGETHRCAVALGLKAGVVIDVKQFKPAPPHRAKGSANQVGAAA